MSTAPALKHADSECPHDDGYVLLKVLGTASTFVEWEASDGTFLGIVEQLPGRPNVYHRLCPACGGHFFAVGNVALLKHEPARSAADS